MELAGLLIAAVAALGIFTIGMLYLLMPRTVAANFGLPSLRPEQDTSWLRLKGIRDVTTGVIAGTLLLAATPTVVGWVLLTATLIPLGDAATVVAARGSKTIAWSVHGTTAVVMLVGAVLLLAA